MMTIKNLKSFIAILLLSRYNKLPRQEMHWQRREDCQNRMATALMTKNEFKDCKQFLRLADNVNLDKTDRFGKARPLFDAINKQCVAYYRPKQHLSVDESMVPYFGKHVPSNTSMENQLSLVISYGCWQSGWDTVFNSGHMLAKTLSYIYTATLDWEWVEQLFRIYWYAYHLNKIMVPFIMW